MNLRAIIIPLFFILLSLVSVIKAEEGADLLAVDSAFADGRFEQAELLVLRILQSGATLSADARARLNLTAGYAVIMQG
ncbi:hypothetical protein KJ815_07200, partial [bacterium]|nr:hypothetical protein [bacterium]